MNEEYTIYALNEKCIANHLSQDMGNMQRLAVPHLSAVENAYNQIVDGNTDSVVLKDFLENGRISAWYDDAEHMMYLGGKGQERDSLIKLDCSKFVVDGMVSSVVITDIDEHQRPGKYLKISWNLDSRIQDTYIDVKWLVGGLYKGDGNFISVDQDLVVGFMSDKFQEHFLSTNDMGLSGTYDKVYGNYQFLAGLNGDYTSGAIGQMSSDIQHLKEVKIGHHQLKYLGQLKNPRDIEIHNSTSAFLQREIGNWIENGTYIPVMFEDEERVVSLEDGLTVGNGDVIIVYVKGDTQTIPVQDIKYMENVFVQKGGVSRYELCSCMDDVKAGIEHKIWISSYSDNQSPRYSDLSILNISSDTFEDMVVNGQVDVLSDTMFVVERDYFNAYGQQLKNLSGATEDNDAVTLRQIRNLSSELTGVIDQSRQKLVQGIKNYYQEKDIGNFDWNSMSLIDMKEMLSVIFNSLGK